MKKTNYRILLFLCLISLSPLACLDEIDLPLPDSFNDSLVIQGTLVKGSPSVVRVSINKLETKARAVKIEFIPVLSVHIFNGVGQSLELEDYAVGRFEAIIPENSADFVIDYGGTYQVKVQAFDGDFYESTLEELIPVPKMDSLKVEFFQKTKLIPRFNRIDTFNFLRFIVDTPLEIPDLPSSKSFLSYDFIEAYAVLCSFEPAPCYIETRFSEGLAPVVSGPDLNNLDYLSDHNILETSINFRFTAGYYLTAIQQSITESTFEYFNQINQSKERTGSPFQPAPGKVKSNFTNITNPDKTVQGYFYATEHDTLRIFVDPAFAQFPDRSDLQCSKCVPEKPFYWE